MDELSLRNKKMNELIKLCKEDKGTYKGYSTKKNKKDLVDFMISKLPSMDDILESSEYELGEALDEMFTESEQIESPLFKDRPSREVIDSIVSDAQRGNPTLDIVFDIHNDVEYGYTYRMYKHKYYKKYGNLGKKGEMILYHGTSRENINEILEDDFALTINARHGTRYGRGIYFTNSIYKALSYAGGPPKKYVIVAVVHIGDIIKGGINMDVHPIIAGHIDRKRYDTSVDNPYQPNQFVKKKNGTYNIIGVLTFTYPEPSPINMLSTAYSQTNGNNLVLSKNLNIYVSKKVNIPKKKANLIIENLSQEPMKLYWVPDLNKDISKMDMSTFKNMGSIGCGGKGKYLTKKGDRFVCMNAWGIFREIFIHKEKEKINIT